VHVAATLADLIRTCQVAGDHYVEENHIETAPSFPVIGIDMPIGLADAGVRQADRIAQGLLGRKASSIFITPARRACALPTQRLVSERNRDLGGPGVSIQAFNLLPKVRELDEFVSSGHVGGPLIEVHPELSFQVLKGSPLLHSKRTPEGARERLELLEGAGLIVEPSLVIRRESVAADDVIDAAVVAWTAERARRGLAQCIPDPPEVFSDGHSAAIWY
jgi:predicted RNase H-like nuclease